MSTRKIPPGWRQLRRGDRIRADDKIRAWNGPRFVRCDSLHGNIIGEPYLKNTPGSHWLTVRRSHRQT